MNLERSDIVFDEFIEDSADKWLRENDPYYKDAHKNKRNSIPYSYETKSQMIFRGKREVPFSQLNRYGISCLTRNDVSVEGLFCMVDS